MAAFAYCATQAGAPAEARLTRQAGSSGSPISTKP
jgi:hypothetical protein